MKELTNAMTWTANDESDYIFLFGEEYGRQLWTQREISSTKIRIEFIDSKTNTIWLVPE